MSFKCPGCDAVHEKVPGYVSQDKMTERLAAKGTEIAALKDRVRELEPLASNSEAIALERDQLKGRISDMEAASQVDAAFSAAKVAPAARDGFKAIYDSAMAGKDEADRQPFHEWVGSEEARGHVLLKGHYDQADGAAPASTPAAAPATPTSPVVNTDTGGDPPNTNPQPIGAQALQDYFASEAYTALPREKRTEVRTSLRAQFKAGKLTALPGPG